MFRYRLFSPDGDNLGHFMSEEPDWEVGDELTTPDGRRCRIRAIVSETNPDGGVMALWEVEPA